MENGEFRPAYRLVTRNQQSTIYSCLSWNSELTLYANKQLLLIICLNLLGIKYLGIKRHPVVGQILGVGTETHRIAAYNINITISLVFVSHANYIAVFTQSLIQVPAIRITNYHGRQRRGDAGMHPPNILAGGYNASHPPCCDELCVNHHNVTFN